MYIINKRQGGSVSENTVDIFSNWWGGCDFLEDKETDSENFIYIYIKR